MMIYLHLPKQMILRKKMQHFINMYVIYTVYNVIQNDIIQPN